MLTKKILSVLFVVITALTNVQAQTGTLKVVVTDASTGAKIPYASVVLKSKGIAVDSAKTDILGQCTLTKLPAGKYTAKAKVKSYTTTEIGGITILENQTTTTYIKMKAIVKKQPELAENVQDIKAISGEKDRSNAGAVATETHHGKAESKKAMKESYNTSMLYQAAPVIHREEKIKTKDNEVYVENNGNTESYNSIVESDYLKAKDNPLSTFSIDVDNASYTNSRRYIDNGSLPPADAVRIEEFINYFNYDYKKPTGKDPFSINTEVSDCPWNSEHKLVHVGIQGKRFPFESMSATNLVFLIDVSGSMSSENKLPLLKKSLTLLVNKMREEDRISLVVYAGAAGLVLPSTSGADKQTILAALNNLQSGGSTAGGAGINLAYKIAKENFIENGNNRVLLATDGDFNVGASSDGEMTKLIESKRDDGIFLTILGFGMGNYKDSKMETIADNGNGNYFYIDNINEAKKVLVDELDGTLYTIAKDVKIQIEFNPAKVQAYRLIGYENRMLKKEDFNNDKKDAGELGAGHTVTALYEIVPVGAKFTETASVDALRYQKPDEKVSTTKHDNEMMLVKFRYKEPTENVSKLITHALVDNHTKLANSSDDFRFSAAVAEFSMVLRNSKYKGNATVEHAIEMAANSKGKDVEGYRADFVKMMRTASLLSGTASK